ncbi:hypothetical protein IJI02_00340 [Candidatus Saccharibacteria bacterium]|nr:hypothetical protein [Candidatus Saccharibacteria bacterium]
MKDYRKTRLVDFLLNFTSEPISVYEESTGIIRTYPPLDDPLPEFRGDRCLGKIFCCVVSGDTLKAEIAHGRPLDDLCLVSDTSHGRDDRLISHLIWAANPKIRLVIYPGVNRTCVQHA